MSALALRRAPVKALLYMMAAVFSFSAMDAVAKWMTSGYGVVEIALLSRVLSPLFALAIARHQGGIATLKTNHFGWHLARAASNGGTLLTFFGALMFLPLADTVAITFVSPLIMSALAVPMLKERVGPRRWAAIVVGFAGVIIITQPSGTGFGWGAALAITAAFGEAIGANITRRMSLTESSHGILFWSASLIIFGFGAAILGAAILGEGALGAAGPLLRWSPPAGWDPAVIAILALSGSGAQFFMAQAFRYGEVSALAPLEYGALVWAALFGLVLWHEFPSATVIAGVVVIVGSSLYAAHREAMSGKGRPSIPDRELI